MRSGSLQIEVIGHYRCAFADEFVGQGKIKNLMPVDFLGAVSDGGIAEGQPGRLESLNVLDIPEIELHFPVKSADCVVEVGAMTLTVLVQKREDIGIQPCNPVEYGLLHMVHVRPLVEVEPIFLRCPLLELLEGVQHVRAIVRFRVISADLDAAPLDVEAISDGGRSVFNFCVSANNDAKPGDFV